MSLSTGLDGEHWADDGDCDEPDGDRPDERVTRSGGWQDQDRRGIDFDGTWAASGVSADEGVRRAWTDRRCWCHDGVAGRATAAIRRLCAPKIGIISRLRLLVVSSWYDMASWKE